MKIALAADHRGFHAKGQLLLYLHGAGYQVRDYGATELKPCDYPDRALPASLAVVRREAERAILIDGSGIGMSLVANKLPGIRAAVCHDELTAEISRRYNNANVLCLAADLLGEELIKRITLTWLKTPFEEGRHTRRLAKIARIEQQVFHSVDQITEALEAGLSEVATKPAAEAR
jgi:ribose 5-phosphate isomerase B